MSSSHGRAMASMMGLLLAAVGHVAGAGVAALERLARSPKPESFGRRYGNNPRAYNGGKHGTTARDKRQAKRRHNIRKHKATAHRGAR